MWLIMYLFKFITILFDLVYYKSIIYNYKCSQYFGWIDHPTTPHNLFVLLLLLLLSNNKWHGGYYLSVKWFIFQCLQVSTHGYSQNQILVWKYPSLVQIAKLTGHAYRVLYLVGIFTFWHYLQITFILMLMLIIKNGIKLCSNNL